MSNCERTRTDLVAHARGELTTAESAAVRDHVASCPACAAEARKLRRTAELVVRATDVEPVPAASARIRRTIDSALAASRPQASVHELAAERASRGLLRDAWDHARWRYEQSATVRRFTLASIGVHAAAAAVLIALLAQSSGPVRRPTSITWLPEETAQLPDGRSESDGLPAYDAMSADGVATAAAPGVRFPNRTTADRWAATMTVEGRRAAFRVALGDDADLAAGSLDRGLEWLATMRGEGGVWTSSPDPLEATAAATLAFAGAGRTSFEEPSLALSADWLAARADMVADTDDRALAARAVAAQFVADFGHLPREGRSLRAGRLASAGRAVAATQNRDGGFGARAGAPSDVASTVAAVAALADVRAAGVVDTGEELKSAARWLEFRRSPDGRLSASSRSDAVVLTSALVESAADAGIRPLSEHVTSSLAASVPALASSPRDAAQGIAALAVSGRPMGDSLRAVLAVQRPDGRWTAARRRGGLDGGLSGGPAGGGPGTRADDASATAWGAVALTRALRK